MSLESAIVQTAAQVAATNAGQAPPATPAAPIVAAIPAAAVPPPAPVTPPPQTVTIPLDQLNAFTAMQARLAKVEEDQQRRAAEAHAEQVKILAAKGQVEEALRAQREQAEKDLNTERATRAQVEERAKRYALDGALATALSSHPLVDKGAAQLTQLWRDYFVVEPQGNSFNVRTQDFKSVSDYVAASLASPEYSHFLRPKNPAGGTAGGTSTQSAQTAPGQTPAPTEPKNLSEAVMLQLASLGKNAADPRLTPSLGFGLRPLAKQA